LQLKTLSIISVVSNLKAVLKADMIAAMKAGDKPLLATVRSINALIKQYEVDQRQEVDDAKIIELLEKARKQRVESINQYQQAKRDDLVKIEQLELEIIEKYLPAKLSSAEVQKVVTSIIEELQPNGMADMGKIMGQAKAKLQGQADMAEVSSLVKKNLS
jgi:uncharacterized protein YqeY